MCTQSLSRPQILHIKRRRLESSPLATDAQWEAFLREEDEYYRAHGVNAQPDKLVYDQITGEVRAILCGAARA